MGRQGEPEHGCLSGWGLHRPERGGVTFRAGDGRIPDVGRAGGHGSGKNLPAGGGSGEPGGSRCDRDSVASPPRDSCCRALSARHMVCWRAEGPLHRRAVPGGVPFNEHQDNGESQKPPP
jgi:hypothetical protein